MIKRTAICMVMFIASVAFGQVGPADSVMLKQYLRQKGMSDTEIKNLSKSYQKNPSGQPVPGLVGQHPDAVDTVSMSEALKQDTVKNLSMYENILKNRIIDPDSLLKTLTVFGLDVFSGTKASTYAPNDYVSTPADYVAGSGDEIIVLLWGRMNEEYRLRVDRDGQINIPHIGPVSVAGLPFNALQKNILDRVQNIEGVQATVSMGELRSVGVFIVGEVKSPGYYTVSGLSNVTNALFAAGGPTRRGSLRSVQLKRNGSAIATVDFYDFLLSGKDNTNLRLKSGDVILVPIVKKMVAIAGNVRRSALYEIKQNTTLKEALNLAGGVSPAAWTNRIQIERFKENKFQMVLDLTPETSQALPDMEVQDGDIIKIFPIVEKNKNAVYLSGNVSRPGKYEYKEGMKLSDVLPDYQALMPETYFDYAIILRQDPPSFLNRIVPFALKKAMEDHASPDNVSLQPRDEVIVYSQDYFEPDRTVTIDGAVTTPLKQKLLENMKIRDLIIKAGGLLDEASLERGELYRRSDENEISTTNKIDFCVSCALSDDPKHNLTLKRFDRVYIRNKKGWEEEKRIVLRGEFTYAGEYVLLEHETLGNLIDRAGGFTKDAYLPAALLLRPSVKSLEQKRTNDYASRLELDAVNLSATIASKGQNTAESQQLLQQQLLMISKLRANEPDGRVVMDMTKPESYRDFIPEDGDVLFVPKKIGTVSVIGEVFNPATFQYENTRAKARYYVEMAGGLKEGAAKKNVYIFKANGSIVTNRKVNVMETALAPGDVVVVPQKIEYRNNFKVFMDTVDSIFKIGSVISILITLIIGVSAFQELSFRQRLIRRRFLCALPFRRRSGFLPLRTGTGNRSAFLFLDLLFA
jgi:protein involved in polysaccharide export with SLBB domain